MNTNLLWAALAAVAVVLVAVVLLLRRRPPAEQRPAPRTEPPLAEPPAATVVRPQPAAEAAQRQAATEGLRRRNRLNRNGMDERIYLDPLLEFAAAGISPADRKLALYHGAWAGSIDRVFSEFAY